MKNVLKTVKDGKEFTIIFMRKDAADKLRELVRKGEFGELSKNTRRQFTKNEIEIIKRLADEGMECSDISAKLGRDPSVISCYLRKNKIDYNKKTRNKIDNDEENQIKNFISAGKTPGEVGKELGRAPKVIRDYLYRKKINFNKKIKNKITEEEGRKIKTLTEEGKYIGEIAEQLNKDYTVILQHIQRNLIPYSKKVHKITADEDFKIRKLSADGKTISEISEELKRKYYTIHEYLINNQISFKKTRNEITEKEAEKIKFFADEGKTVTEISHKLKRDGGIILSHLKKNKIKYEKARKLFTEREDQKIKKLAAEGKDAAQISKAIGRNAMSVRAYMERKIIPYKKLLMRKITEDENTKIIELISNGKNLTQIGKQLLRDPGVIAYHVRKEKIKYKKHTRRIRYDTI